MVMNCCTLSRLPLPSLCCKHKNNQPSKRSFSKRTGSNKIPQLSPKIASPNRRIEQWTEQQRLKLSHAHRFQTHTTPRKKNHKWVETNREETRNRDGGRGEVLTIFDRIGWRARGRVGGERKGVGEREG